MDKQNLIIVLVGLVLLGAAYRAVTPTYHESITINDANNKVYARKISGTVNKRFYARFSQIHGPVEIEINSKGGWPKYAQKIADHMIDNDMSVIIKKNCLSACAEYFLAAAEHVTFNDLPIIGFHGNPMMRREITIAEYPKQSRLCYFNLTGKFERMYIDKGVNKDFWKEQESRLHLIPEYEDMNGCPALQFKFEHKFWMPTSEQLRDLLGLKFEGQVCADSPECIQERLLTRWKKGTTFVVGDTVYVSIGKFGH